MRRIYESSALRRDSRPFTPSEEDTSDHLQSMRSVNSTRLSRLLIPTRMGCRAISVDVSTPRTEYPLGATIPFRVTMRNPMPFPITIQTDSPLLWAWDVDGRPEASDVPLRDPPDEPGEFVFDRGERKRFTKRWQQSFRVSDAEWRPATPGEYTIGAGINVGDPDGMGVYDEATVRIVPE